MGAYRCSRRCELSPKSEVTGSVQTWYSEEGWGVLVSPEIEGTVFAHFSVLDMPGVGFRDLHEGDAVVFRFTTPGQDGCDHRAHYVRPVP
jgi:CspA family cold shock protein